ncbi:methylmalonyl-CoA mutase [mine drainage metagenome]|uniref:Methylmalonyl-CoA mutase n=1 Tax=mine drainage metagenome TaxID=410659 RepID=A0A1J5QTW6_9ZZZZ
MRDVYGATSPRSQQLRFHTQTAGVSLTAAQPLNNVVRTAIEALAAVLGGTQSLHTNALDEVLALPTAQAAQLALRTQQVILEETGVADVIDPLGGSWFVEALTDRVDAEVESLLLSIKNLGDGTSMTSGILRGIEDGWFISKIAESSFEQSRALDDGERGIVGVTRHLASLADPLEILRISVEVERDQVEKLKSRRAARNENLVQETLKEISRCAGTSENLIPPMIAAARAEASLGEICDVLREHWPAWREPSRF